MSTNWQIGDKIENCWEIHKILKGGMGIVYIVYDHETKEPYAVKSFQDEVFAANEPLAERFKQEALTWINLDTHQNITKAWFVRQIENKPFLFLEFVSGGDLSGFIGTVRLNDLSSTLLLAVQFCDGMVHAIAKGIEVHRDIKPENCLITADGILKVTDFGLAKVFDGLPNTSNIPRTRSEETGDMLVSRTGAAAGTPLYMAPEQFEDAKHVDVRADIYSFGVMLFQMVTGRLPFVGRTWHELELSHRSTAPPKVGSTSEPLNDLIQICLAKDPARRFSDFAVVRNELARLYTHRTGSAPPSPAGENELNFMAWSDKGISLAELGHTDEGIDCLDKAIDLNRTSDRVWMNKGNLLLRKGRTEEALACFDHALSFSPTSAQIWLNKANCFEAIGKPSEAIRCLDRAIELNPAYSRAWHNKGVTLMKAGQYSEAVPCFEQAAKFGLPESAELIELCTLLKANQGTGVRSEAGGAVLPEVGIKRNWVNEGIALANSGHLEEALASFDQALEEEPTDAIAWANKGTVLSEQGKIAEALACYDKALQSNPQYAHAWYLKGVTFGPDLKQWQQAIDCYDHALAIDENFEKAWCNKAAALAELNQFQVAIACYDRALKLNPRDSFAWSGKAGMLFSLQRFDDAIELYKQAQLLGHPRAAQMMQMCREELQKPKATQQNPKGREIVNRASDPLQVATGNATPITSEGPTDGALDRLSRSPIGAALKLFEEGCRLSQAGQHTEAIVLYERAIEAWPGFADAHYNRAVTLEVLGRFQEAMTAYQKAFKLGNPNATARVEACRQKLSDINQPHKGSGLFRKLFGRGGKTPG